MKILCALCKKTLDTFTEFSRRTVIKDKISGNACDLTLHTECGDRLEKELKKLPYEASFQDYENAITKLKTKWNKS